MKNMLRAKPGADDEANTASAPTKTENRGYNVEAAAAWKSRSRFAVG
jgi:hypothetical protein